MFILIRSFISILLLSSSTWLIANKYYYLAIALSVPISLLWTLNVKDISSSAWKAKMCYITGGLLGTTVSLLVLPMVLK